METCMFSCLHVTNLHESTKTCMWTVTYLVIIIWLDTVVTKVIVVE